MKDYRLACAWTKADPYHRQTTPGSFWVQQGIGIESYVMEDRYGIVFFFKLERASKEEIEVHIQFAPAPEEANARADLKDRTMRGLMLGFEWLERILAQKGITALFFTSQSRGLILFAKRHLGFVEIGNRFVHWLPSTVQDSFSGKDS